MNLNGKNKKEMISCWVDEFSDLLYSWALSKTRDSSHAEDLVQETFLSAYQSIDKFREDSGPKTWLFGILNIKIKEYFRLHFRNHSRQINDPDYKDRIELYFLKDGSWNPNHAPNTWNEELNILDNEDFSYLLYECLDDLPESWNSAVKLKYLDNTKGSEICEELGISKSNFWQILHRAKLQLRECLEFNWFKGEGN